MILEGRDLDKKFVSSIRVEVDESNLKVGPFRYSSPDRAHASISVGPKVAPGDYWLKMSNEDGPVTPHFGSIIRVHSKK